MICTNKAFIEWRIWRKYAKELDFAQIEEYDKIEIWIQHNKKSRKRDYTFIKNQLIKSNTRRGVMYEGRRSAASGRYRGL